MPLVVKILTLVLLFYIQKFNLIFMTSRHGISGSKILTLEHLDKLFKIYTYIFICKWSVVKTSSFQKNYFCFSRSALRSFTSIIDKLQQATYIWSREIRDLTIATGVEIYKIIRIKDIPATEIKTILSKYFCCLLVWRCQCNTKLK